ncbi:hypothetical protein ACIBFB_01925 [Nocardiopsis sp. NPDC050513]|uniref:hypothetical protein n=1 Tax=Nocardiopsis sp. NPDC050513 TaxID=3364338 RepID=UPI0037AE4229
MAATGLIVIVLVLGLVVLAAVVGLVVFLAVRSGRKSAPPRQRYGQPPHPQQGRYPQQGGPYGPPPGQR